MNADQRAYATGRLITDNAQAIFAGLTLMSGLGTAVSIVSGSLPITVFMAGMTGYVGLFSSFLHISEASCDQNLKKILAQRDQYPNELAEEIIIEDRNGLDGLLNQTARQESKEWGTFLKAHASGNRSIIDEILSSEYAEGYGLIKYKAQGMLILDIQKSTRLGYNGCHHFHPQMGAANYSVSKTDRNKPCDWVDLLTFMMGGEPEVIGFNHQYPLIYLPSDASKTRLVITDPQGVHDYLARRLV
jgi:hypothetical protein